MMKEIVIPPWVPLGVRAMYRTAGLKCEISQRLLIDPRMERAWKDLMGVPEPADMQHRLQEAKSWFFSDPCDGRDCQFTDFDYQAGALFYQVILEIHQPERVYWSKSQANKMAKPFIDAAKLCNNAPQYDITLQFRSDLVEALQLVGKYFRNQGRMMQMHGNPRVLGRDSKGSLEKRGHSRTVATMIRDIFAPVGDFPHSAVARFVAVSLGTSDEIDELKEGVRTWCKNLPPESGRPQVKGGLK